MTTIPPIQDYDDDDENIDFRKNRWNYWAALKKIRVEYMQDLETPGTNFDAYDFEAYIEERYGLRLNMLYGDITDQFEIVDEGKYLFFLLKYT